MYLFVEKKQVKSEVKFFDIKVRMLHMYEAAAACASSTMGILLIVCCCCSLLKLFPVPFHSTFLLFTSKALHEKRKKRNKT
jgi:hypothetical protein